MLQAADPHAGFPKEVVACAQMDFQEIGGESSEGDTEDLDSLKALTEKLKLQTRRPSYLEWQERLQSRPWTENGVDPGHVSAPRRNEDADVVVGNICGFDTIDDALEHLRKELVREGWWCAHSPYTWAGCQTHNPVHFTDTHFSKFPHLRVFLYPQREMQVQDNRLARQLIRLRGEIHQLKVEQVCHRHKEMLDDATYELEECGEESDLLCDIPMKAAFALSTPLKHLGLTKMNINSRRFSLC